MQYLLRFDLLQITVRSTVIEGFEGFDGHVLQHEGMRGQQITS
jgi:hypothetical protein